MDEIIPIASLDGRLRNYSIPTRDRGVYEIIGAPIAFVLRESR
jgi:hypothetical protein